MGGTCWWDQLVYGFFVFFCLRKVEKVKYNESGDVTLS